jgi:hypothetical protein
MLRLLTGTVGETDDREPGQAAVDVGLDLDAASLEPDESMSDGPREHPPTLGVQLVRGCAATCRLRQDLST